MPRPQKLHPKPRAPLTTIEKASGGAPSEENTRNFELELCWCIQQLERVLLEKKLSEKHLTESWKVLAVLKNNSQPIVRKRQLMRTHFGDYRAKMAAEEKKLVKMANSMKIVESPAKPKATFIRRSAFLSAGADNFKFNFQLSPQQLDSNLTPNCSNLGSDGNRGCENSVTCESAENSLAGSGAKSVESDTKSVECKSASEKVSIGCTDGEDVGKSFKFNFSEEPFKFNFGSNLETQ